MNPFTKNVWLLLVPLCASLLVAPHPTWGATLTVDNNIAVNGSVSGSTLAAGTLTGNSATLTISGALGGSYAGPPNEPGGNVFITGGIGQWEQNCGDVIIKGGTDISDRGDTYNYRAGSVIIQGGLAPSHAGDVILRNMDNPYLDCPPNYYCENYPSGNVKLQTGNGWTRFWLTSEGRLNANNNDIINVGSLSASRMIVPTAYIATLHVANLDVSGAVKPWPVLTDTINATTIVPSQAGHSLAISAADGAGNAEGGAVDIHGGNSSMHTSGGTVQISGGSITDEGRGGDVVLQGGSGGSSGTSGDVVLQGGPGVSLGTAGNVILRNSDMATGGLAGGHVELRTGGDNTIRFWLQSDGSLNAENNYVVNARVPAQGDLSMGTFTSSP